MAFALTRLLALSALVATGLSLPAQGQWPGSHGQSPSCNPAPAKHLAALQAEMPTTAGLPPNTNVTLKYAAVGVGHQNYTCNGTNYVQTGQGDGALAVLYDATHWFYTNKSLLETLPGERLQAFINNNGNQWATDIDPRMRILGLHFFDSEVRPNFDLFNANPPLYLLAAKIDAVVVEPGDVAWLFLVDEDQFNPSAGLTNGLNSVYRVETAGGDAPATCTTAGQALDVPYAAEYWFYD